MSGIGLTLEDKVIFFFSYQQQKVEFIGKLLKCTNNTSVEVENLGFIYVG